MSTDTAVSGNSPVTKEQREFFFAFDRFGDPRFLTLSNYGKAELCEGFEISELELEDAYRDIRLLLKNDMALKEMIEEGVRQPICDWAWVCFVLERIKEHHPKLANTRLPQYWVYQALTKMILKCWRLNNGIDIPSK